MLIKRAQVAKRKKRKPKGVQKDNSGLEEAPGPVKTRNACFNPTADRSCENSPTYEAGSLQVASPEAKDPEGDPLKSMTQVTDEEATIIEPHPATPSPAQRTTYTPPLGPQAATSRASRPAEKSDICLDLAEPSPPSVPPSPLLEATEVQSPRVSQCGDWEVRVSSLHLAYLNLIMNRKDYGRSYKVPQKLVIQLTLLPNHPALSSLPRTPIFLGPRFRQFPPGSATSGPELHLWWVNRTYTLHQD